MPSRIARLARLRSPHASYTMPSRIQLLQLFGSASASSRYFSNAASATARSGLPVEPTSPRSSGSNPSVFEFVDESRRARAEKQLAHQRPHADQRKTSSATPIAMAIGVPEASSEAARTPAKPKYSSALRDRDSEDRPRPNAHARSAPLAPVSPITCSRPTTRPSRPETARARPECPRDTNRVRVRHVGDRQLFALATETHLLARNHALHAQAVHGNPGDQLTPRPLVDERRLWGDHRAPAQRAQRCVPRCRLVSRSCPRDALR